VSEVCTLPCSFDEELALWRELDVHHVGVLSHKLHAVGRDLALGELRVRGMGTTTVITKQFDLARPATWDANRKLINDAIDIAAELGGIVYLTPGRRDGRTFDALVDALATAVAPCAAYGASRSVTLAFEPTLRTDASFVHTIRDAIDVADRTELSLVADIGTCWMERDYDKALRKAGSRIAIVQLCDAIVNTDVPSGNLVTGDGELPIREFVEATLDAGYSGLFEIEMFGPRIASEGHLSATRRAVEWTDALLTDLLPVC
jgi:sugar phosphate isomerase/epimerase